MTPTTLITGASSGIGSMEYVVSIRICFSEAITKILKQEKDRFVAEYGSSYKSEPHITLYLDRYTQEGFPHLLHDLKELRVQPFTISLLKPKMMLEKDCHRNLYIVDVSATEQLQKLHAQVLEVAIRYRSPLVREKVRQRLEQQGMYTDGTRENLKDTHVAQVFDPHITLGEVGIDDPQPNLQDIEKNLKELKGEKITVSNFIVIFDGKGDSDKKFKLIEKVSIPFS